MFKLADQPFFGLIRRTWQEITLFQDPFLHIKALIDHKNGLPLWPYHFKVWRIAHNSRVPVHLTKPHHTQSVGCVCPSIPVVC